MKYITAALSVILLISSLTYSSQSSALPVAVLDCQLNHSVNPNGTWQWNHKCWIDIQAFPDIPGVDWVAITGYTTGTAYWPIPDWTNSISPLGSGSTAGPITRYEELEATWMNAFVVLTSWTAKYRTANFEDPYLWAPTTTWGNFYYKLGDDWIYLQEATGPSTKSNNFCAGCGASGIPYPGTP